MLDRCDAVVFAVPPVIQSHLGSVAAGRGKAVLLEQPMSVDLASAERLAGAVAATKVVSQLALTWRYAEPVRRFLRTAVPRTRPQGGTARLVTGLAVDGPPTDPRRLERGLPLLWEPHVVDVMEAGPASVEAHGHFGPSSLSGLPATRFWNHRRTRSAGCV